MSFSEEVKYELCSTEINDKKEAEAELIGFIKGKGVLRLSKKQMNLSIMFPSIKIARRFITVMKILSSGDYELFVVQNQRLWKQKNVQLDLTVSSFGNNEIYFLNTDIPEWVSIDPELFGVFLRGLYLVCGTVINPVASYHLEINHSDENLLNQISFTLRKKFEIQSKVLQVRNNFKLTIRAASDLIEFLNLIGAIQSATKVEQIVQRRSVISDVNRSMNFLSANADRIGNSTARQLRAIKIIEESIGLDSLNDELRLLAYLRLENEDMSLRELGEMMEPKMTKSMVFTRMKKIISLAEQIEKGKSR